MKIIYQTQKPKTLLNLIKDTLKQYGFYQLVDKILWYNGKGDIISFLEYPHCYGVKLISTPTKFYITFQIDEELNSYDNILAFRSLENELSLL